MNKCLAAMVAAGSVVSGAEAAGAGVLAESAAFSATGVGGTNAPPLNEFIEFSFNVYDLTSLPPGPGDPPESARRRVFDRMLLTESDEGRTILFPASEAPGAFDLLTNGVNNLVELRAEVSIPNGTSRGLFYTGPLPESPFLFNTIPGLPPRGAVDFKGHDLTHIGVKVQRLRLNEARAGNSDFSLTMVFVPEPAGPALFCLGGLDLLRRRRVRL